MSRTILIVEDEYRMRHLIAGYLNKEGFNVIEAVDGIDALEKFKPGKVDLILLDIMMPRLDGLAVCSAIRKQSNVYIILLTAKSQEEDKILGYEIGADDYITKPFSIKVLIAKVKALIKRLDTNTSLNNDIYEIGGLVINELSHSVAVDSESIDLSPKEYDLLLYLVKNQGILLSRDTILNGVWGYDYDGDLRTVDTHIKRLRQKLKGIAYLISTIRSGGYKFEVKT